MRRWLVGLGAIAAAGTAAIFVFASGRASGSGRAVDPPRPAEREVAPSERTSAEAPPIGIRGRVVGPDGNGTSARVVALAVKAGAPPPQPRTCRGDRECRCDLSAQDLIASMRQAVPSHEVATAYTDGAGRYELPRLEEGQYILRAESRSGVGFRAVLRTNARYADIDVAPAPRISGQVRDEDDEPVYGARVEVIPADGGPVRGAVTDGHGRFRVEAGVGRSTVVAWSGDYLPAREDVDEDGEATLVLARPRTITGRIEGMPPDGETRVEIFGSGCSAQAVVDADGRFQFTGLRPGVYTVVAHGGELEAVEEIDVGPGQTPIEAEMLLE